MKKTNQNRGLARGVITRLVLGVLLLGVLGGVLTSCGGSSSRQYSTLTMPENYKFTITDQNGLNAAELEILAKNIAQNAQGFAIREGFVAALNGYNLYEEGFDDSKVPLPGQESTEGFYTPEPERAAEFALFVLKKFEVDVSNLEMYQEATTPESAPAESAPAETVGESDAAAPAADTNQPKVPRITAADVSAIVECFRTTVDTATNYNVIDQLLRWIGIGFGWMIDVPGFGSFILGTFYYAIALEILMLPLGIRQQTNSRKQAMLRPREMAIRNKYKGRNDTATQQKVTEEINELYTKEGYSPMSGCLPLLITMPFLIFLYYIVVDPMVYMMGASKDLANAFLTFADTSRAAGGLGLALQTDQGTIEVLSLIKDADISGLADFAFFTNGDTCLSTLQGMVGSIPDFNLFGVNMGLMPAPFQEPYILMLIPVLTFVVYWASGKISRMFTFQPMQQEGGQDPAQGCSNGMMNIMMPAMSAFFAFMVPAAVGIYWMMKSILGTVKQIIIAKAMPLPVFSEEDYKAAERELAGRDRARPKRPSGTRNPNVRSLHHIDDEDYETPASAPAVRGADKPDYVEPEEEAPRTADTTFSEGVTMKEEDDRPAPPAEGGKKRWSLFGRKKDE